MLVSTHCQAAGSFHLGGVDELRQGCLFLFLLFWRSVGKEIREPYYIMTNTPVWDWRGTGEG